MPTLAFIHFATTGLDALTSLAVASAIAFFTDVKSVGNERLAVFIFA
jgi:hypothetical protein